MNKYLFILGLVGTVFLSACSASDDLMTGLSSDEERAIVVEAGRNSEIPITMNMGGRSFATTRGALNSDDENYLFETPFDADHKDPAEGKSQYLGVYCLARGKQAGAPSISDIPESDALIKWVNTTYAKWLDNVPARVIKYEYGTDHPSPDYPSKTYSDIQFRKDDLSDVKPYYYPFGNWYYYDFYAYYPRVSTVTPKNPRQFDDLIVADFTITGKEDIIHAKASSNDAINDAVTNNSVKAYSSKYFRLKKDASVEEFTILPQFQFKHKLTQLCFSIQPHAADAADLFTKGFKLTSMSLKDVFHKLSLVVASKKEGYETGDLLVYEPVAASGRSDIQVWNDDDTDPLSSPMTIATAIDDTSLKPVGYAMVPPSDIIAGTNYSHYFVKLTMTQNTGVDVPDTVVELIPPTSAGFEAGHKYNIVLEIYSPTEIHARAFLSPWEVVNPPTTPAPIPVD